MCRVLRFTPSDLICIPLEAHNGANKASDQKVQLVRAQALLVDVKRTLTRELEKQQAGAGLIPPASLKAGDAALMRDCEALSTTINDLADDLDHWMKSFFREIDSDLGNEVFHLPESFFSTELK